MNILIVSSNFSKGGLETQLVTYHNKLLKNNNLYYCFQTYTHEYELKNSEIFENANFSYDINLDDFITTINNLINIIKKYNIDVVHIHPSYCLFSAALAANIAGVPAVYNYHGFASFNFGNNALNNYLLLYKYIFKNCISAVLSVSQYGINAFKSSFNIPCYLLKNGIDEKKFKIRDFKNNKRWALVSRLDIDKRSEIIKLLSFLPNLNIKAIDIYGNGTEEDYLKNYVAKNNLNVNFYDYENDVSKIFEKNEYNGIIGGGRSIIESLFSGYPAILIEYSKIVGVMTLEKYEYFKSLNFVDPYFEEVTAEQLNDELNKISKSTIAEITDLVRGDFNSDSITKEYENIIKVLKPKDNQKTTKLFNELQNCTNKSEIVKYSSVLYDSLKNTYIDNLDLDDITLLEQTEVANITKYLVAKIDELNIKIKKLEDKINCIKEGDSKND